MMGPKTMYRYPRFVFTPNMVVMIAVPPYATNGIPSPLLRRDYLQQVPPHYTWQALSSAWVLRYSYGIMVCCRTGVILVVDFGAYYRLTSKSPFEDLHISSFEPQCLSRRNFYRENNFFIFFS